MGDDTWPGFITCFQCLGLPIIVNLSYWLYFCKRRISDLKGQSSYFELQLQCKNTVAVSELAHRRTCSVPGSILSQCLDIWTTLTRQDNFDTYLGQCRVCLFLQIQIQIQNNTNKNLECVCSAFSRPSSVKQNRRRSGLEISVRSNVFHGFYLDNHFR